MKLTAKEWNPKVHGELRAMSANSQGQILSYITVRNGRKLHGFYNYETKQYNETPTH